MNDITANSDKLGYADIFLTITCNPNWPEILRSLFPEQLPKDRPDLCARVFNLKRGLLLQHIVHNPCGPHNPGAVCIVDKRVQEENSQTV